MRTKNNLSEDKIYHPLFLTFFIFLILFNLSLRDLLYPIDLLNGNLTVSTLEGERSNDILLGPISPPLFSLQDFQRPQILFIVGDPASLDDLFDQPFYNYMNNSLNYGITLHDDNNSYQYEGYDAIVISQTILETDTVDSLTNASIPILSMEAGTYDEFKLGTASGVISTGDSIYILNNNNFITQGLTNQSDFQVYNDSGQFSFLKGYNTIDPEVEIFSLAQRIKTVGNERTLVILDKGKKDWNLSVAPERRAFWGAPQGNVLNQDGWYRWEKALLWTLYDDMPGNATIRVDVNDLNNRKIPNAKVNLTNSQDSLQTWSQNTTNDGFTTFTNIPYGYYNITIEYKDSINDTLIFLEIAGTQTYEIEAYFTFTVQIPEYIDNTPPLITNILFDNDTGSFLADVFDESALTAVYLNLTAINITDSSVALPLKNYTMVQQTGDTYYNDTALLPLNNTDVEIFYNIIATDIASNNRVTVIQSFLLGDPNPPIIHEYNVTDYGNGTLQFYANITDSEGFVQDPVVLKINGSLVEMHLNDSGYWYYRTEAYYNITLNYTIYSAEDNVGNKVSSTDFGLIIPTDTTASNIWGVTDSFNSHKNGYVEIMGYVYDWNDYQSGVNVTDVRIIFSINGEANITYEMLAIGEITYYFNYTFDYNDMIFYWITASDLAGNIHPGFQHGPFIIDDNAIPFVLFGAKEFGNGTVEFNATVVDWPDNETGAVLYFTQDVDSTWFNISMTNLTETFFVDQVHNFDYNLRDVWFYVIAYDSAGNIYEPVSDQYLKISLSDIIPPEVIFSVDNSTINDGEITIIAYANDPYGSSVYVNNTFYLNITTEDSSIEVFMEYFEFYRYIYTESFKYGHQINITVWTSDSAGNLGIKSRIITITDHAPPKITNVYVYDNQQGSIFFSVEVYEGVFGSGLPEDNSSIIIEYSFKSLIVDTLQWNGSGNFYEYSISGFEPGDVIVYQINATDIAGNTYSTSLQRYIIPDKTPPVASDWAYSQELVDNYLSELTFWINASDPFGNIVWVNISIFDHNTSEWIIMDENMVYTENYYYFSTQIVCNHIFQYTIQVTDGENSIVISEINQRTLDFQPPEIIDFNASFNQSETWTGTAQFWIEINDSFKDDLVVVLSVFDETSDTWLLDGIQINKTVRSA
ncbi:MAG: carboxypeptidase-like regulatory domain-containing protein, partial [Candidatus Hodarchaeota archaeon]